MVATEEVELQYTQLLRMSVKSIVADFGNKPHFTLVLKIANYRYFNT